MKNVEERLRDLPRMAETAGLQADEALRRRILRAAEGKGKQRRNVWLRRAAPVMAALVILVGAAFAALPALQSPRGPQPTQTPLLASFSAGDGELTGDKLALDVPAGSITIKSSRNPSYRSIWAKASGGNFPLVGVNGRYYRLLTNPTSVTGSLLGSALGTVDTFTSEPALAGKKGVISNVVAQGETVYAVSGMNNALVAAPVDGQMRVFQRVSFGDNALIGNESLADTLKSNAPVALELSGVGTVNDPATAQRLVKILTDSARFRRAAGSESNQSLLIQLKNGIVMQMSVNGERIIACGTWTCPEFFDAFQEALQ